MTLSEKIKGNTNFNLILTIIVVIILVSSLILVLFVIREGPKKEENKEPKKEIDDRISPLTTQELGLRIHRIRKKGIVDQIMNAGNKIINNLLNSMDIKIKSQKSYNKLKLLKILDGIRPAKGWDDKPSFSYFTIIDNYEFQGCTVYNDWDTGYINEYIFKEVEQEKICTNFEFKIIEKVKTKKFFKTNIQKVEMDSFKVTYDFRTGTWSGDDQFNDKDGYGHFNGEHYEIWFSLYQNSDDMDDIPWWTETNILGTDPLIDDSKLDPDEDGIPTEWEWRWGYDPFTFDNHSTLDPDDDGLQNIEEYKMEKWLANPFYPEIYIEADSMAQTPKKFRNKEGNDGWKHEFYFESQQMLMDKFNEHNITLHIDDGRQGDMSQGGDVLPFGRGNGAYQQNVGIGAGLYANYFSEERVGIFRYVMVIYGGGWCHPQSPNHYYDCMSVPHNYNFYKNQLAFALSERAKRIGQAIQVMHELGHSLGMVMGYHEGVDNASARHGNPPDYPWFDYVSVMNYDYFWLRYLDYSDGTHGEFDKNDWDFIDLSFFQEPSERMEGITV